MTAVNHIIRVGESIPADVYRFEDRFGDEFERVPETADTWDSIDTASLFGSYIVKHYAPLRVLEVTAR